MKKKSILFLAKQKPFAEDACELIKAHFLSSQIAFGATGTPFPAELSDRKFDYVISYISPWIVPTQILRNTKIAAINFHPGTPKYPGIGCTNFAIYNGEKVYGVTVHHMSEKVDSGAIILVERFRVFENDSVYSLTQRCYAHTFIAFTKIFEYMLKDMPLPVSREGWKRRPYTRKELNELCRITEDMSKEEVLRRIKATTYPHMPGAYTDLSGTRERRKERGILK